jgi:hypothetical protein
VKHYYSLLLAFALLLVFCPFHLLAQDKKDRFPLRDAIHYASKNDIEKVKVEIKKEIVDGACRSSLLKGS